VFSLSDAYPRIEFNGRRDTINDGARALAKAGAKREKVRAAMVVEKNEQKKDQRKQIFNILRQQP
jgi:hypothetical protein